MVMNKLSNFTHIFRGWGYIKIPITESVELDYAFFLACLVKGANVTKSRSFFLAHGLPSSAIIGVATHVGIEAHFEGILILIPVVIGVVFALLAIEVLAILVLVIAIVQFEIIHLEILLLFLTQTLYHIRASLSSLFLA